MNRSICECAPANRRDAETHTPGPWTIADDRSGYVFGSGETVLACARGYSNADVHLIAAAPDLLAALRRMINDFASYADEEDPDQTSFGATIRAARAAIAKAEGRP
jgi:hypothetical protein